MRPSRKFLCLALLVGIESIKEAERIFICEKIVRKKDRKET